MKCKSLWLPVCRSVMNAHASTAKLLTSAQRWRFRMPSVGHMSHSVSRGVAGKGTILRAMRSSYKLSKYVVAGMGLAERHCSSSGTSSDGLSRCGPWAVSSPTRHEIQRRVYVGHGFSIATHHYSYLASTTFLESPLAEAVTVGQSPPGFSALERATSQPCADHRAGTPLPGN
jgi:hypothetical protein